MQAARTDRWLRGRTVLASWDRNWFRLGLDAQETWFWVLVDRQSARQLEQELLAALEALRRWQGGL